MNTLEEEIERLRKENAQLRDFLEALKEYPERTSVPHVYGGGY